mmetsp:Transcript_40079/g.103757  ORF Transcript_40079/g.103757 Transcript_40079/m.103757 type:complete len:80 (-) Transcript_40079:145-384(-)
MMLPAQLMGKVVSGWEEPEQRGKEKTVRIFFISFLFLSIIEFVFLPYPYNIFGNMLVFSHFFGFQRDLFIFHFSVFVHD